MFVNACQDDPEQCNMYSERRTSPPDTVPHCEPLSA